MLDIARIKEILADANLTDEEAEIMRDRFRDFAEIIFHQCFDERSKKEETLSIETRISAMKRKSYDHQHNPNS